jgi:lipid II:glycine glycyltransferase (peptidoglycan interpeptide bridge formation enzyme)
MDLSLPLDALREGMAANWKRNLKQAEKHRLDVVEGAGDDLFEAFIDIYKEMVSRKAFAEPNDINQFRVIQSKLPEKLKMKVMLCGSDDRVASGLICSAIGDTAIYLFGATSNAGLKSGGSYLLHWKLIEKLKQSRTAVYNLNGINPDKNPGTFKFKNDLAGKTGKDVYYVGRFDSHASLISRASINLGDTLRTTYRRLKERSKTSREEKASPKVENEEPGARGVAHTPNAPQVPVSMRAPQVGR